ncbi:MAG: hypothetical protein ACAI43_07485, partial [Phycisphaerae bacterium]|nr:hypothetical protein [Tepidisphaeraceae bacterium]
RPSVYLTIAQRRRASEEMVGSLLRRKLELIVMSVDRVHFHALCRFPDRNSRKWIGIAKKESSHYLKVEGLAPLGGLWTVRFKCLPVEDRSHQLWTVRYIRKHAKKGAAVWDFRNPEKR